MNSLMTEVIEDHVRLHIVDPAKGTERVRGADELIEAVQAYLKTFGWLWMDPLAGIFGAAIIASWSYGLIRDLGAILLDMNPDQRMANNLRQAIESEADQLADFHLWPVIISKIALPAAAKGACLAWRGRVRG